VFDDLVQKVSQQAGITTDKARQAVDTVVSQIKTKMPPVVSTHIDELMAGNFKGTVADVEQKFKQHFGDLFSRK
jgi:BMFP domain-containing protein YqiC